MNRIVQVNQKGSILLIFLITLPFIILITMYYTELALTSFQVARQDQQHTAAQLSADAGADYGIEQISLNNSWAGTGGEVALHNDSTNRTTYAVTVVNGSNGIKTLDVIGRTYSPVSSTTPSKSVSIAVDLYPVSSGAFSIISGEGGLVMSNSSKVVGGSVFVNGGISLSNTAQIGLSTNPVKVQVADDLCPVPPDSTYPKVCSAGQGGQPITINNTAHIYGSVTATNQTNGSGMTNSGLVAGGSVAPQALPNYNRSAQEAAVTSTISGSSASCGGNQSLIWPANTKIVGNVTLAQSCQVTVQGNIWITGSLSIANTSQLIVDNGLGTTAPNIMVDGSGGVVLSNSGQLVPDNVGTGFKVYTFWSTATCSPECTTVTGTDLYNTQSVTTISLSNSVSAQNSLLYAYWSQVNVANIGQIGALVGQTVQLSNNSAVTFGASSGTSSSIYVVKGYRRL